MATRTLEFIPNPTQFGSRFSKKYTWFQYYESGHCYSMPQRVGHASLANLEVLHQKANGNTIVFTHCEQENEIT